MTSRSRGGPRTHRSHQKGWHKIPTMTASEVREPTADGTDTTDLASTNLGNTDLDTDR